jgi:membrane-anchored mycosin MYCP
VPILVYQPQASDLRPVSDVFLPTVESCMSETSDVRQVPVDELAHQLVVSLEHADVVLEELAALARIGILTSAPTLPAADKSVELGLGLIRLSYPSDLDRTAADQPDDVSGRNLNDVLTMVRTACSFRHRGWVPTIGKNRVMNGIGGEGGQVSGGGGQVSGGGGQVSGGGGQVSGGGGQVSGGGGGFPSPSDGPIQPEAVAYGGAGVRIGVLDTPLVWNRAWGGNVRSLDPSLPSTDRALEPSATPESYSYDVGHANFVASLIAAQAPEADIGVLGTLRSGDASATAWDVARAMVSFLDRDVAILNLSLGCYTDDNQPPLLMQRAIQIMTPRLLVVAAAGNHRQPTRPRPFWPAALDDVIAVGAYGDDYRPAPFTPHAPWVDVVAPGVDIVTNYFDGCVAVEDDKPKQFTRYAKWQGTSFAAGLATGEIASRLPVNGDARWVRESLWSGTYDGILIKGSRAK